MKSKFITTNELAGVLEISVDTVRRKEHRLGLDQCRDKICRKPIRYWTGPALAALREHGIDLPTVADEKRVTICQDMTQA